MRVRLFAGLRAIVGHATIEVELAPGATLSDLIDRLAALHPDLAPELFDEAGALSRHINLIVDGRSAAHLPQHLATPLTTQEEIHIFPAVAGG
ncbi:MAG: MoaD family protein [Deltaproteobacteria bacterium]|nr:MoaD family protein [Deltaproteobacteria bacterium]MBW2419667.1 MoaD family protein [Deltaproteobacteria bacterium]